ncbi:MULTISPECIES: hypothetical protein [unclassified Streptomyces]|uniref:hypothetical protein n=1 Tax=unclassified Streptomyces TaxID=2593676 RepID=UPI002E23F242|nr:hypothetical protein OG217_36175 [Streptomyces sp. NBC_01023]
MISMRRGLLRTERRYAAAAPGFIDLLQPTLHAGLPWQELGGTFLGVAGVAIAPSTGAAAGEGLDLA